MDTPGDLWPPHLGDYARVRQSGVLSEVIDVAWRGTESRYTLNVLAPGTDLPQEYRLDDLARAWPIDWT